MLDTITSTGELEGCDDAMQCELEAWEHAHPDAPGFRECLAFAREIAADPGPAAPWQSREEAQEEAWAACARLESEGRYIDAGEQPADTRTIYVSYENLVNSP